ncbi:hypothetical protein EV426DRAFT_702235 [Tirmania nivea]|nr:hypothetical protein EV426DRAFT_702235 [Tirmania nivea]
MAVPVLQGDPEHAPPPLMPITHTEESMAPTLLLQNLNLTVINTTAQITTSLGLPTPAPTEIIATSSSTRIPNALSNHQPAETVLIVAIGATLGVIVVVFLALMCEKYLYKRGLRRGGYEAM